MEEGGEDGGDQEGIMFGFINLETLESSGATTPTQWGKGKGRRMTEEIVTLGHEQQSEALEVLGILEGASTRLTTRLTQN